MAPVQRSAVGRADLLRMLRRLGDGDAAVVAGLAGFEPVRDAAPAADDDSPPLPPPPPPPPSPPPVDPRRPALQAVHYAMVAHTPRAPAQVDMLDEPTHRDGPRFDGSVLRSQPAAPPQSQALVPARRMASLVRAVLRPWRPTRQPDVNAWVQSLARGRLPLRLRMCERRAWSRDAGLLVQPGALLDVWRQDLSTLAAQVHRWSGGQAPVLMQTLAGEAYRWQPGADRGRHPWQRLAGDALPPLQHTLWAGDAQAVSAPAARPGQHLKWTALLAAGAAGPAAGWPAGTRFVAWDHGQRLVPRPSPGAGGSPDAQAQAVASLLCSLALAVRVEPALLRAIRLAGGWPAHVEASVWWHEEVVTHAQAVNLRPDRVPALRAQLLAGQPLAWRRRVAQLVRDHHHHLSPLVRMEEAGLAQALAGLAPGDGQPETWATALRTRLAIDTPADLASALDAYVRRAAGRRPGELWSALPGLAESYVLAEEAAIRSGGALPDGLPPGVVQRMLARGQAGRSDDAAWQVVQRGEMLWLDPGPPRGRQPGIRLLGELGSVGLAGGVVVEWEGRSQWQPLVPGQAVALGPLDENRPWVLNGAQASVTVAAVARPPWADEWGRRASAGMYALAPLLGNTQARFEMADPAAQDPAPPFLITRPDEVRLPPLALPEFTHWQLGIDRPHGLFADLLAKGLTQRFRWLPPGEFWMGSPDDEPERFKDEGPRHRVRLSQGFWLADSACTQALWLALMGNNKPSHFKGDDQRPVENVSFDEVQAFLARLQDLLPPGCEALLPTEAQWEYACRAGTDTPFNLPAPISRINVNFDASVASKLAVPGEESKTTVPVKSLPPNAWGLYEMHGNVWEWCADDQRDYAGTALPEAALEDPWGPVSQEQGARRAVRGGAWFDRAGNLRSALRKRDPRDDRDRYLGFRVALRSSPVGSAPEGPPEVLRPGPEAPGSPARRDAGPAPRGWGDRLRDLFQPAAAKPAPPPRKNKPPKR